MLLKAAELLAAAGELPVNLRFACDGEEEVGGHSIVDWLAADERGADAAIVFDSGMVERDVPAFNIAVRGLCYFHVKVRTGVARPPLRHVRRRLAQRDARADADAVGGAPARRAPARAASRRDRAALRRGARGLAAASRRGRRDRRRRVAARRRRGGRGVLPPHLGRAVGRRARHRGRLADAAEDGDRGRGRGERLDPARRRPGSRRDRPGLRALLREAAPAGAEVEVEVWSQAPPASSRPTRRPSSSASTRSRRCSASGRCSSAPAVRSRSSPRSPRAGVATILTGFALNESNVHSPNERIPSAYLPLGIETAAALYRHLADLG